MRVCCTCKRRRRASSFWKSSVSKDGLQSQCKDCSRASNRLYYKKPGSNRKHDLKRKYGLSLDAYNELLVAQGGLCALCNEPPKEGRFLAVDHDHFTDEVRALLCDRCNSALGIYETVVRPDLANFEMYLYAFDATETKRKTRA